MDRNFEELTKGGQPATAVGYTTKDSGVREEFESGMVRDTQAGKARFDLLFPLEIPYAEQMLTRAANLMERGMAKYGERNWEKANSQVELDRAKASALRHMAQWMAGETDEDHAAAVIFNLMVAETITFKLTPEKPSKNLGDETMRAAPICGVECAIDPRRHPVCNKPKGHSLLHYHIASGNIVSYEW